MTHPPQPQLSVVIASSRPHWLAVCLQQYHSQTNSPKTELLVVAEGDKSHFEPVIFHHKVARVVYKDVQGHWGAYAKDVGIEKARGDYICFWDDDNIYYPDALKTLYRAAKGYDLGIVRAKFMGRWFTTMPKTKEFKFGDIDTMCICVKRDLAVKARWSDHQAKGTDFAYVSKLLTFGPTVNWVDTEIGEKLVEEVC